jgi:hypothetical protein
MPTLNMDNLRNSINSFRNKSVTITFCSNSIKTIHTYSDFDFSNDGNNIEIEKNNYNNSSCILLNFVDINSIELDYDLDDNYNQIIIKLKDDSVLILSLN